MKTQFHVGVLIGSLRQDSICKKMARAVSELAPQSLLFKPIDIGRLPLYNEDLDTVPPVAEFGEFRTKIRASDAVLFITPEYNRSVPGLLKNAIDVGSAPHGQNSFEGKPAGIISLSPGAMGAFGANHHLRQCLVFLNMPTLQQPEAYIGGSESLFDSSGRLSQERTREYLAKFLRAFEGWIVRHSGQLARPDATHQK
jgi:chromate reductase